MIISRTVESVLDTFKNQPNDIKIENKTLVSLTEITEVRRAIEENTKLAISCYNRKYDPYGWEITVVRAEDYTDYKVSKENKKLLKQCVINEKAGAANQQAADRINENSAKVKTAYKKVMIHKNDPDYQLPKVKNPQKFYLSKTNRKQK